jgi:hypothetical protein
MMRRAGGQGPGTTGQPGCRGAPWLLSLVAAREASIMAAMLFTAVLGVNGISRTCHTSQGPCTTMAPSEEAPKVEVSVSAA